jgi:hypothetical protein
VAAAPASNAPDAGRQTVEPPPALLKEWATRDPAAPEHLPFPVPEPILDIDLSTMPGVSVSQLAKPSSEEPGELVLRRTGGDIQSSVIKLINRSGHGLAAEFVLQDAGGADAGRNLGVPVEVELGRGEEVTVSTMHGMADPARLRFSFRSQPTDRPTLQEIAARYEAFGWRCAGPTLQLVADLNRIMTPASTAAPQAFASLREAVDYGAAHPGTLVAAPDGPPFSMSPSVNIHVPREYMATKYSLFFNAYIHQHPALLGITGAAESKRALDEFAQAWKDSVETDAGIRKPQG